MNGLPRDPVLDLMENSEPGRNFASPEPVLRAYYLSRLPETWVPEKPYSMWRLLKDDWRNLARLCGFEKVPSWETLRKRFKLLEEEYGNEITCRLFEIRQELEKRNIGKKALPIIAKHQHPRRRNQEDCRSNYQERKERIDNALSLFELIDVAGTDELAERFFIKAKWPDGGPGCPRSACGSGRVEEEPGEQLRRWLCVECEERFDIKTGTVFEGARYSLRTILWAAYLMLQSLFGTPSLDLACLLKEEGRRLSHKDALDITHRIQTALMEPRPRFGGSSQLDDSLMGYANGVQANVIAGVTNATRQAWAQPIYGPVNLSNSTPFIDNLLDENANYSSDSTKAYPEDPGRREKVNHTKRHFVRYGKRGELVSTNLDENLWSTFQEMLNRRRAVTATYLPLYLAEHLWRYNHRSEPTIENCRRLSAMHTMWF